MKAHIGVDYRIELGTDLEGFFAKAPRMHPNTSLFIGNGMRRPLGGGPGPLDAAIRWLGKLVDELAKSKAMEKIGRR